MHRLRHFYYQNKEKIWKVFLLAAFILGIIYVLNSFAIDSANKSVLESNNNYGYQYGDSESTYIQGTSAITGEIITKTEANKINDTISKFITNCQNKKYEEAYNMLSEDCIEVKYNTIEKFIEQYITPKFTTAQTYSIQKWNGNTYKVEMSEDILATGNISNNQKILEYITIVNQNDENKLNISEYIGKRVINKTDTQKNLKITVNTKQVYMDYEIYEFEVENLSNDAIKLDSLKNASSIYLIDNNGNTYKAHKNELLEQELILNPKIKYTIRIKFANTYSIGKEISKIVFKDIILNYDNKEELKDTYEYVINI